MQRAVAAVLPRGPAKDALHGVSLGHPLHPLLTDLPIGFWTSAWVLGWTAAIPLNTADTRGPRS